MKNSFVAFFDILGFKNLVEKNSHEELQEIYNECLYESLDMSEKYTSLILKMITPSEEMETLEIKTYVISDSIIFVQDSLTQRGLLHLIAYCQILIGSSISDGIPIRGGLSFGPVTIDNKRGTTIFGLGLTKAYNLESKQQWAGGIIDPECFDIVPKQNADLINQLISNKKNPLITKYQVPLKDGTFKDELVFDWTIYSLLKDEKNVRDSFVKYNKEITQDVQFKIDNTVKFFNDTKQVK